MTEYVSKEEFDEKIAELMAQSTANSGAIQILCGYIYFKRGGDDFKEFLQIVIDSGKFSPDAQVVAQSPYFF